MDCAGYVHESAYIATVLIVALACTGLAFFIGRASARADSRPFPPEDTQ